jgi:hypothetical protein
MFENPKEPGAVKTMELSNVPTLSTFVGRRIFIAQSTRTPTVESRTKQRAEGVFVFDPTDFDYANKKDREYMNERKGRILGTAVFMAAKTIVLTKEEMTEDTVLLDDNLARASRVTLQSLRAGFEQDAVKYAWPITEANKFDKPPLTCSMRAGNAGAVQSTKTKEAPRRRLPPPVCTRASTRMATEARTKRRRLE